MTDKKIINKFSQELNAISIDLLSEEDFHSEIKDDYEAVLSIIRRHPMNQHELKKFINKRKNTTLPEIIKKLTEDPQIKTIVYKGFETYRFKSKQNKHPRKSP